MVPNEMAVARAVPDLTELQQAERDLVRFFELSLDLFCTLNPDGSFRRVNPNFLRVLRYTSDELLARPFLDFVHPEDRRATQAGMAKLAQGLPVVMFRNRYRDAQGAYHWFEWMSAPIPEENAVFAIARDVSQQVRIEQELAKIADEFRKIDRRVGFFDTCVDCGFLQV